jgi:hypothetical protein
MPEKMTWWSAPRREFCTRTPQAEPTSPWPSMPWCENGDIGPVMLGRDHHDTGGTDSPFRETSNIKDGSNIMADMATHCFAGNAARG